MTRILALGNLYPPHHYGGYELSCQEVLGRLREVGHETTVLTSDWLVPGVDTADEEGVFRTLRWYWDDHVLLTPAVRERIAIERHNRAELARVLSVVRPEVVTVWNMGAMSLGLLTELDRSGVPVVYIVGDDWPVYGPRLDPWTVLCRRVPLLSRLTRLPAAPADLGATGTFCFVSGAVRASAETAGHRFPVASVIYGGVDRRWFTAADRPDWRGRLLYVGRLDPRKAVGVALRAVAAVDGATLDIVGRGDDREESRLRLLADELGVGSRVRWLVRDRRDLVDTYREADALLFTSAWQEPFGLVPLEAMACGLPVVAMPSGGNVEFLRDGVNCRTVAARDESDAAAQMAAAVRDLAASPELRARLAAAGDATARVLSLDRMVGELEAWIAYAVDSARDPAARRPPDRDPPLTEAGLAQQGSPV